MEASKIIITSENIYLYCCCFSTGLEKKVFCLPTEWVHFKWGSANFHSSVQARGLT